MKVDFLRIINLFKPKRRLFSGVVFFFIYSSIYSQSKKEQIDILSAQRDSLVKVVSQKEGQITTLTELNQSQSEVVKEAEKKNLSLSEQLHQKDELINELTKSQKCISAKTEVSIEVSEGLEPSLIKLSYWNGFILKVEQEGENETYPNRLYGFRYGITDVNAELPVGYLFNEKRDILEKRLNELIKLELTSAGIPTSQIIHYYFPVKTHDSGEGAIMLFIDHDIATFYFEQFMYGVNDRREIEMPLNEINEFLIDSGTWTLEAKRKYATSFDNNSETVYKEFEKNSLIHCQENETNINENDSAPIVVQSCKYLNFWFVDSIFGDCLYPECFKYSFFKLINDSYIEVDLPEIFNEKITLLEQEINRKCQKELSEIKNPNSEKYDDQYITAVYQNHTFKGLQGKSGAFFNKIHLFSIDENGVCFRTFPQFDTINGSLIKDGVWLLVNFTLDEIVPYLSQ